jgi:hypothetical protein
MNLTITHRSPHRPVSAAAAAAVIAAALRAGHTVSIANEPTQVRYTFVLDDPDAIVVTADRPHQFDGGDLPGWVSRLAAAAARLI